MEAVRGRDDPWNRLGWQVPLAMLLTLLGLMSFLRLLEPPPGPSSAPRPLDVQVVELPAAVLAPPPAAPKPEIRPVPPPPVREQRPVERRPDVPPPPPFAEPRIASPPEAAPPAAAEVAKPSIESRESTPLPPPVVAPQSAAPSAAVTGGPSRQDADQGTRAPAPPTAAPNPAPGTRGRTLGGGNAGARAIYQPLPEVPEALRHRTIEITAVARFRVAANGTAQVELTEPTGDPELNRAVLDTLKRWRFFPAMQDGKPVASMIDIRIPISVK
jgi:protein TonB